MEEINTGFEIGDVVRLKSGGPRMTVNKIDLHVIGCQYFNEVTHKVENFDCDYVMLEKIN